MRLVVLHIFDRLLHQLCCKKLLRHLITLLHYHYYIIGCS